MTGRPQSPVARRTAPMVALVAAAVLAGIWFRLTPSSPLWLDEAMSVNIARASGGDLVDALVRDGHPPLYYWLLHHWMSWFGAGDLAVRSLSAVFGVATVPLVGALGERLGGRRAAVGAVVMVALSPYAVRYSSEARMYALVMLLVSAGALLLDDLDRRPSVGRAAAVAAVTGALLWTHYWGLYLIGLVGLLTLVRSVRQPERRRGSLWMAASLASGGVTFLPWVPKLLEQAAHTGTPWAIPPRPTQVVATTLSELGGGSYAEALVAGALLAMVLVVAFVPIVGAAAPGRVVDDRPRAGSVLTAPVLAGTSIGTLALGWLVSQLADGAYAPRYAAVVVPFLLVLAVVGLLRLAPPPLQAAVLVGLLGLESLALVHNGVELRTQAGDHAAVLEASAGADDLVVVCPDQLAPDLQRAMLQRDLGQTLFVYPGDRDPAVVDWRDYGSRNAGNDPSAIAARLLAEHARRTIWVVWQGGYRTLLEQCEALVETLATARRTTIVSRNGDAFESSSLWRLAP